MVIFELSAKEAQQTFKEIKKILTVAKAWKISTRIEITVLDGKIQLVGLGFIKEVNAMTTGSCKLVIPVIHWFELVTMSRDPILKVVVTEGEAMVGRVTVRVQTTFFETDKILRSISLPANPKAIDYWKLSYQNYTEEELVFNGIIAEVEMATKDLNRAISKASKILSEFRISKKELTELLLSRISEREKIDLTTK